MIRFPALLLLLCYSLATANCTRIKTLMYEGFERDRWQMPREVIQELELKSGDIVADIGAGSGYFTLPLAGAVEPEGVVYALDIDGDMLEKVEARARERQYENIKTVRVRGKSPGLPPISFDLLFFCNTYHHLSERTEYFADLRNHLKIGGRIAIIEFKPEGWQHALIGHATEKATILEEMKTAGFRLERASDILPRQNFLIFVAED
jgi:predicted methyltransferase